MRVLFIIVTFLFSYNFAEASKTKNSDDEKVKELDLVDFNSIKDVLKSDQLEISAQKKIIKVKKIKKKRLNQSKSKYDIPSESTFWRIASEYWLVKNAPILKWNFNKPDYGLQDRVSQTFKKLGIINLNFHILLVNTTTLSHSYLPSGDDFLVLLSVPFMRSLNLNHTEISLLILENYIRSQMRLLEQKLETPEIRSYIGSNFFASKKVSTVPFMQVVKGYSQQILTHGYNFQQQYAVTKKMKQYLSGETKLEETYVSLLSKINQLVTNDPTYKYYVKIYPSPIVQRNWFLGKK